MTTGIEFFLTQCVQPSEKHYRRWDWHILDSERLQQDILQVLLNKSSEFGCSLFGLTCECTRQPERGLFDLAVISKDGHEIFIEIKCDQKWRQKEKQLAYLSKKPEAKCAMFLLSQQAVFITRTYLPQCGEQFFKISYREIYTGLETVRQRGSPPELIEFIDGYRIALQQQEQRTRDRWGDPDA